MLKKILFLLVLFFLLVNHANEYDLLYIGAGINNIRRKKHNRSKEFRVEYKFHYKWWFFHPLIGSSLTKKKQFYAYSGISLDFILKNHIAFVPNFVVGYYNKGKGKDLGCPLEFRTGIEFSFIFENKIRLGSHISHTSNASIGRKNPGLETFYFFIAIPIKY